MGLQGKVVVQAWDLTYETPASHPTLPANGESESHNKKIESFSCWLYKTHAVGD